MPWILEEPYDVVVVSEARLSPAKETSVSGTFARAGWSVATAPAVRGPGGGWQGGFLVAARAPRSLFRVPRKVASNENSWRWCHVVLEDGSPSGAIHLFPVYCPPRGSQAHLKLQATVLSHVFEEASALGDVPVAVLGDFNSTPEESYFLRALGPRWHVLAQTVPCPTVVPSDPRATPRRLDFTVANDNYAMQASSEFVDVTAPTRPHHVVSHVLQCIPLAARRHVMKPRPLAGDEVAVEERFGALAPWAGPAFWEALLRGDVEDTWSAWCAWAEAAFGSGPLGLVDRALRGQPPVIKLRPATARQARPEWGASTAQQRHLLMAHRRLRALGHLRGLPLERRRWEEEHHVCCAAARSLWALGSHWAGWAGSLGSFSAQQLNVIAQDVERSLGTCLHQVAKERSQGWRDFVSANLARDPHRIYAWCKGHVPMAQGVASATVATIAPNEVADLVQRHWAKWWDAEPLGSGEALHRLAGLAKEASLPPLSGEALRGIVRRVPVKKASGPDQWAFRELRLLPTQAFDLLALFLALVERSGTWPNGLTGALVSLIPKPGATDATGLRPIGLMPVVYRVWAVARQDHVRRWLRPLEHLILGGRQGVGADLAALEAAVLAGEASASGDQVAAAFLDIS
ncbi:MAG: hypothetical protein GY772_13085, partial [bacterium]|nr:hypothetical protein [bacterium]